VHRALGHPTSESEYIPHPVQVPSLATASQKHPRPYIILHIAARSAQKVFSKTDYYCPREVQRNSKATSILSTL
jgi:hypothetical protein